MISSGDHATAYVAIRRADLLGPPLAGGTGECMEIIRKPAPALGVFSRRGFLTGIGATLVSGALAPQLSSGRASAQAIGGDPFTLGVASGDPTPDGIVLWPRLAPKPLEGGGMPEQRQQPAPAVHRQPPRLRSLPRDSELVAGRLPRGAKRPSARRRQASPQWRRSSSRRGRRARSRRERRRLQRT